MTFAPRFWRDVTQAMMHREVRICLLMLRLQEIISYTDPDEHDGFRHRGRPVLRYVQLAVEFEKDLALQLYNEAATLMTGDPEEFANLAGKPVKVLDRFQVDKTSHLASLDNRAIVRPLYSLREIEAKHFLEITKDYLQNAFTMILARLYFGGLQDQVDACETFADLVDSATTFSVELRNRAEEEEEDPPTFDQGDTAWDSLLTAESEESSKSSAYFHLIRQACAALRRAVSPTSTVDALRHHAARVVLESEVGGENAEPLLAAYLRRLSPQECVEILQRMVSKSPAERVIDALMRVPNHGIVPTLRLLQYRDDISTVTPEDVRHTVERSDTRMTTVGGR